MITAGFDPADVARLKSVCDRLSEATGREMNGILNWAAVVAIQTASREQGPSRASSPSKLSGKYKYRPIIQYNGTPNRYGYRGNDGRIKYFETPATLTRKQRDKRGAWLLKKEIEIYDKKRRALRRIVWRGPEKAKAKEIRESTIGRIPHYGAAKAGWLKALDRLPGGKPPRDAKSASAPEPSVTVTKSDGQKKLEVTNRVKYAETISPQAAAEAMRKTAAYMQKRLEQTLAKLEKQGKL